MDKKKHQITLSVIIPAFRQQRTIYKDLKRIKKTIDSIGVPYEIIVVVDGEVDNTKKNAKKIRSRKIKVVGYKENLGKGYAIRYGVNLAKENVIAFLDAGMEINPNCLQTLLAIYTKNNADIVIGSKLHPESKVDYPWQRRILSWGYQTMVKVFFDLSINDTQVGIKLFRKKVIKKVLPRLLVKKYAFDIEILAVANYYGYTKIYEAPVELHFDKWSSVISKNFLQAIYNMVWDTVAVYYRLKILHYYDDKKEKK